MSEIPDEWLWPRFDEPELTDRLLMDQAAFLDLWLNMAAQLPPREFTDEVFATGIGYPWPRPDGSFVLSEGEGLLLRELDAERRQREIAELTGRESGRIPMLAIGSNASPEGLWRKFGHFPDPADRTLLAVAGTLHDFDVGATAELALYGALPATVFPSPGARVSAMAIWVTPAQLTQLTWAEIPYWLGRLDARFDFEAPIAELGASGFDRSLVFVNRFGAFAPEGEPIALAAIPAEVRNAREMTQTELLTLTAALAFDAGMSPQDLVRAAFEKPAETGPIVTAIMRSNSLPFESDRWTPFPG
ncbi:MAG: hypothetical protein J0H98_10420 [Solirubrobacterales bacterium]|nr:hypothetical protein [Solirubrobacterales bacterium]